MPETPKPLPRPHRDSQGFWAAAAKHVLTVQRCDSCGRMALPPMVVYPACLSPAAQFSFVPVSQRGRLRTWTIMRDAFLPGFRADVPWVVGEAERDDAPGVRLLARLIDGASATLQIDTP